MTSTGAPPGPPSPAIPTDLLFLLRKSAGHSSRQSLDRLGRRLNRRDLGHAGTLDPFANGLLLALGGRATRLVPWIQEWDKEYTGRIRLGVATDTLDATGTVTSRAEVPRLGRDRLEEVARGLEGDHFQVPPMYSAVRSGGTRLYELARKGIEVERTPRPRSVGRFAIEAIALPDVEIRVVCSSGTYVRVLAESFGRELGLPAHLATLTRQRVGPWTQEGALDDDRLDGLTDAGLARAVVALPEILAGWPTVTPPDDVIQAIRNGRLPGEWAEAALTSEPRHRLLTPDGRLLALAGRGDGQVKLLRVFDSAGIAEPSDRGGRRS